jgi:hypothetical protein
MTEEQRDLIRVLWWLCVELRAGSKQRDLPINSGASLGGGRALL